MEIKRVGSQASNKGPADWFTGTVRVDPLFQAPEPARVGGAHVTFGPGARTAWHTHPLGQTLIVTSGLGGYNSNANQSKRSGPATWSGSRQAKGIGMAPRRRQP
jgi:quercetin dioxygenase-like cupin family protein